MPLNKTHQKAKIKVTGLVTSFYKCLKISKLMG